MFPAKLRVVHDGKVFFYFSAEKASDWVDMLVGGPHQGSSRKSTTTQGMLRHPARLQKRNRRDKDSDASGQTGCIVICPDGPIMNSAVVPESQDAFQEQQSNPGLGPDTPDGEADLKKDQHNMSKEAALWK
ncbi:hypothetical protein NDU88_006608 [Pleurodeles waltl]|uniref:Uncharacterized protein n=1 Tax=Pleurodeles waltl TaxID=8319 RepID=A0AAV7VN81_PLEWA|nr:hypothetical protein NDU88_006608 [Pleurodeles waltl]